MAYNPFQVNIFVATGDPEGLRLIDRSDMRGKAVMFPRAIFPDIRRNRDEINNAGVYILLGQSTIDEDGLIYIGQGDPVRARLDYHHIHRDFWTHAVFFIAPDFFDPTRIEFLEARLITLAKEARRVSLDNQTTPGEPATTEANRAIMEAYLQQMLEIMPLLGIFAFEQVVPTDGMEDVELLFCNGNGVSATGYDTPGGFVVRSGSFAVLQERPALQVLPNVRGIREELIENGVLTREENKYVFTQDYAFTAPSTASSLILGRPSNGRIDWKNANGRTLKDIQRAQAEDINANG